MITTVTSVQRFATKTLYTRARATDGSTMLAPMSPGGGKGLNIRGQATLWPWGWCSHGHGARMCGHVRWRLDWTSGDTTEEDGPRLDLCNTDAFPQRIRTYSTEGQPYHGHTSR